jgi:hypothetical protein
VSFSVCVALCAVFCSSVVCYFSDMCICVLCLIVVPVPPGRKHIRSSINNNNNNKGGHVFFPASIFHSTNSVSNIFRITLYYLSIHTAAINNETSYKIPFRLISYIHEHARVLCYLSVTRNRTWCVDTGAVVFVLMSDVSMNYRISYSEHTVTCRSITKYQLCKQATVQ